jgi:hypothetical protein
MTVGELRSTLEELCDAGYEGSEVYLGHQPSWPLAEVISGVVAYDEVSVPDDEEDEDKPDEYAESIWIVAGGHPYGMSPYAPRCVMDA